SLSQKCPHPHNHLLLHPKKTKRPSKKHTLHRIVKVFIIWHNQTIRGYKELKNSGCGCLLTVLFFPIALLIELVKNAD
ncbi:hypothetical protein, partial [Eubacterium callanderi]|uniref:hypothetical protein n=1 Tax=Eubacterium callanderi TaxID=53442 RepID=UPI003AF0AC06